MRRTSASFVYGTLVLKKSNTKSLGGKRDDFDMGSANIMHKSLVTTNKVLLPLLHIRFNNTLR